MDNLTFRSRLLKLLQKSRKAVRLYSSIERTGDVSSDFREVQAEEWRSVTADLLRDLTSSLENPNTRRLVSDVYAIRDRFYSDWRLAESDLHIGQRELIAASEHGDFTKAASLSTRLVRLKAKVQACQAAHHEIHDVLVKSKVSEPPIILENETTAEAQLGEVQPKEVKEPFVARVIPLRQKRLLGGM